MTAIAGTETVSTTTGRVRGERNAAGVTVFRGIPYAQPPVGRLRFRAPESMHPWRGVREATRFGPAAPQSDAVRRDSGVPPDVSDSDEYLTLNVWTPELGATGRPVMVWMHGGAYQGGAPTNPVFEGTRLAREGDVAVVTVSSRIGFEGFAEIRGAPSNRGLLDLVAALEWVRDNIEGFGGDRDSITVFGQSSGAGSIAALMAMPAARGSFHRAITQSVPATTISRRLATDVTAHIADEARCAPTANSLARVEAFALAEAAEHVRQRMRQYFERWGKIVETLRLFSPVLDGETLPTDPWSAGGAPKIPLLTGHTRDEYRAFTRRPAASEHISDERARQAAELFAPDGDADAYYELLAASGLETDPTTVFETVNSDWEFRMPSAQLALVRPAASATYLFELAYTVPKLNGAYGAPHGADNPLIFGNFGGGTAERFYVDPPAPDTDRLSSVMRRAWTEFARTGDPGWDILTAGGLETMIFDVDSVQQRYPHERTLAAYRQHLPQVLDLVD
jgi:para-nitrobenzyl esterase